MKRLFLFLLLIFSNIILISAHNGVNNITVKETTPGIITFNWECDTLNLPYCYFYIGEYEKENELGGHTHTFVALLRQQTNKFYKEPIGSVQLMECNTEYILSNDTLEEHINYLDKNYEQWHDLWFKYVNIDNRTLKGGCYTIGIGTGNGIFQSGFMTTAVIDIKGNNIEFLNIHNNDTIYENIIYKYLGKDGLLYIIHNNMVFNSFGFRIK